MVYRALGDKDERVDGVVVSRVCTVCSVRQPFESFHFTSGLKYRRRMCKSCDFKRSKKLKESIPADVRRAKAREIHLRKTYGITVDEFDKLWQDQNGQCCICAVPMSNESSSNTPKKVQIDHCHETGKVRGLLCFSCNTAIGKFGDSIERLRKAIEYLSNPPSVIYRDKTLTDEEDGRKWRVGKKRVDYDNMDIPKADLERESPRHPFTENDKRRICEEYSTGEFSQSYLAVRWGTSQGTISRIVGGRKT